MVRRIDAALAAAALAVGLAYWLIWAVAGPVTNGDSQVYNLARLWVIDADGFFLNRSYTWITQLILPWAFDAVHYPLLLLGRGYAVPSFLCLLGIMAIAFTWARERGDTVDGLTTCLGLLAMPMVVMQATTTKNDLVLGLCLFCWVQALRRHGARPGRGSLLLAALALSFMAGSKLTGLLYAAPAAAVSLWVLRRRAADMAWFAGALALMLVLNGSGEVFLNNLVEFGDWRGDPLIYAYNSNPDGWRGLLANELRYTALLLDPELLPESLLARAAHLRFELCQSALSALGVEGRGIMSIPWRPMQDADLLRVMTSPASNENRATYGLVGALVMTAGPVAMVLRRRLDFPAALLAGGIAAHLLIALTIGWHLANLRYFVAAACVAWTGASLMLASRGRPALHLGLTIGLIICAALGALRADRNPENLRTALADPDALLQPLAREQIARARAWKERGEVPVVLVARRSRVFHVYDRLRPHVISIPEPTEQDMIALDHVHRRGWYHVVVVGTRLALAGAVCEDIGGAREAQICTWRRTPTAARSP